MTEVGQRFSTRTEERLLAVVYTLQQRTYKTGLSAAAPVPDAFKKELAGARAWCGHVRFLPLDRVSACYHAHGSPAGVCKACGSRDTSAGKLARLQQQFAQDLEPSSPGAPQTLGDMTERLKVREKYCCMGKLQVIDASQFTAPRHALVILTGRRVGGCCLRA